MSYFLVLDVGTTNIKAFAFFEEDGIWKSFIRRVTPRYPRHGWSEIEPVEIMEDVYRLIDRVIDTLGEPIGIALTNQRSSTVVWDKETGEPLYNMITWQDTRTEELVEEFSSKFLVRFGKILGVTLYGLSEIVPAITRTKKGAYIVTLAHVGFGTSHSSMQLRWLMDNVPEVRQAIEKKRALFGTIDSWVTWNLTGKHVTDYTNASATGLFDPFYLKWSDKIANIVGIPRHILPSIITNDSSVGIVKNYGVPLLTVIADQQASLYMAGVEKGTLKLTNGTGTFVDINVGERPYPADAGVYPLIALKTKNKTLYLLEGSVNSTGSAIEWLIEVGLIEDYLDISRTFSNPELPSLVFIPAFSGLSTPYNRPDVKGALFEITRDSTRDDIVKALIAGIAMRCAEVIEALEKASGIKVSEVIADGGASASDDLLQLISDFSGKSILRPFSLNGSAYGTYMIAKAVYENRDIIEAWKKTNIEKRFVPSGKNYEEFRMMWRDSLKKLL